MDLNVQYQDCSWKSSKNDYDYTSHLYDKIFRNENYLEKLKLEGHFDPKCLDSSELKLDTNIVTNRRGKEITRQVDENGSLVSKKYYQYTPGDPIKGQNFRPKSVP